MTKPAASNAIARIGTISLTLSDEARPGWLSPDGSTEYLRAAYPSFVTKFGSTAWFLPGTTGAKFKLKDLRNLAFVMAGDKVALGQLTGNAEYRLTAGHLPEHSHTYDKPSLGTAQNVNVVGSILGGILTGLSIPTPAVATGQSTGKTGAANPAAIPLTPLSLGVNVFIFAGLPQTV